METVRQVRTFQCDQPGCETQSDELEGWISLCTKCKRHFCTIHRKTVSLADPGSYGVESGRSLGDLCESCQSSLKSFLSRKGD